MKFYVVCWYSMLLMYWFNDYVDDYGDGIGDEYGGFEGNSVVCERDWCGGNITYLFRGMVRGFVVDYVKSFAIYESFFFGGIG